MNRYALTVSYKNQEHNLILEFANKGPGVVELRLHGFPPKGGSVGRLEGIERLVLNPIQRNGLEWDPSAANKADTYTFKIGNTSVAEVMERIGATEAPAEEVMPTAVTHAEQAALKREMERLAAKYSNAFIPDPLMNDLASFVQKKMAQAQGRS